jgi:hypothetical protein
MSRHAFDLAEPSEPNFIVSRLPAASASGSSPALTIDERR